MAVNVKSSDLKNSASRAKLKARASSKRVKGKNVLAGSNLAKIGSAYKTLSSNGYTQQQSTNVSDNDLAISVLNSMGCSICNGSKNMSLIASQTDTEVVDNENIFDASSMANITNANITSEDKFPNSDSDPFYTLDDAPARTKAIQRKQAKETQTPDVQKIVADIMQFNLNKTTTTLKQFSNNHRKRSR